MMMAYGLFVFELATAPYQQLKHQMQWRHEAQNRVGVRPARQFLGPGDDNITLSGKLLPQFTGGQDSLDDLRDMAADGLAWPLVEGTGVHYGVYVITGLSEDKKRFFRDGAATEIDFQLSLVRVDDARRAQLGTLRPADVSRLVHGLGRSPMRG